MQIFQWTVIQSTWLGPMHQTDLCFNRLPYRPIVLLYNFGAANDEDGDDEEGWWWWWSRWCNRNTYRSKQNWVPAHDYVDSKIVHETPWEFVMKICVSLLLLKSLLRPTGVWLSPGALLTPVVLHLPLLLLLLLLLHLLLILLLIVSGCLLRLPPALGSESSQTFVGWSRGWV